MGDIEILRYWDIGILGVSPNFSISQYPNISSYCQFVSGTIIAKAALKITCARRFYPNSFYHV